MRSTVLAAALTLALGSIALPACNSTNNNNDPKDRVSNALKDANLKDVDVSYDKDEHVVHLKGNVDTTAERSRAEQVAEQAVGTSGKVLNEVTVKGVDEKTADDRDGQIKDRLKDLVNQDPQLKEHDIDFSVNNGAVEVSGTVQSAAEKDHVTQIARSVDGVKDVANGLQVKPEKKATGTSGRRSKR